MIFCGVKLRSAVSEGNLFFYGGLLKQNAKDDKIFGSNKITNKVCDERVMKAFTTCAIQVVL
jgi:hypothetical protein